MIKAASWVNAGFAIRLCAIHKEVPAFTGSLGRSCILPEIPEETVASVVLYTPVDSTQLRIPVTTHIIQSGHA